MPVLSVRLKLRAREEARLEAERLAAEEAAAAEEEKKKTPTTLSYLKPLNKIIREKTLAEPPPRLLLLRKARAKIDTYSVAKRGGDSAGRHNRTAPRGRSGTPRGLFSTNNNNNNNRVVRGHHSTSSQNVPDYTRRRTTKASRRPRAGKQQSIGQRTVGRFKNGNGVTRNVPWTSGNSIDQRLKRNSSTNGQRRTRSSSASRTRSRVGAASAERWRGHASKSRPRSSHANKASISNNVGIQRSMSARRGHRNRNRSSASPSPLSGGRTSWPAMSTIVQAVAPPSRLKLSLRANHRGRSLAA